MNLSALSDRIKEPNHNKALTVSTGSEEAVESETLRNNPLNGSSVCHRMYEEVRLFLLPVSCATMFAGLITYPELEFLFCLRGKHVMEAKCCPSGGTEKT